MSCFNTRNKSITESSKTAEKKMEKKKKPKKKSIT